MINKVILIGNLGRDPEVRHLDNGSSVAKFSVATNESYMDKAGEWQTQTEWHDVVVWRRLAERAEKTLSKGKLVYIEGKLTHRKWQDRDGKDRYTTEVVANTFRILERRDNTLPNSDTGYFPGTKDESQPPEKTNEKSEASSSMPEDDDLPF